MFFQIQLDDFWPSLPLAPTTEWGAVQQAAEAFEAFGSPLYKSDTELDLRKVISEGMRNFLPTLFFLDLDDFPDDPSELNVVRFGCYGLHQILNPLDLFCVAAKHLHKHSGSVTIAQSALESFTLRLDGIITHVVCFRTRFPSKYWDPPSFATLQKTLDLPQFRYRIIGVSPSSQSPLHSVNLFSLVGRFRQVVGLTCSDNLKPQGHPGSGAGQRIDHRLWKLQSPRAYPSGDLEDRALWHSRIHISHCPTLP